MLCHLSRAGGHVLAAHQSHLRWMKSGVGVDTERSRGAAVMASGGACDCGKTPPGLVPLQLHFPLDEAEAQTGQVTRLRPHSVELSFQSHRSLCSRTNIVPPLPCCYVLHPGPWTGSSHWGSGPLWGGKQCRHPYHSGEEPAQKGRDTCSRPHGWWVGIRPPNVCGQPCWGASSFLPGQRPPPPHTHTCQQPNAMWPSAFKTAYLSSAWNLGAWAEKALEMRGKSHALLECTSKSVPLRPDLSGGRGVCGCVTLQLWNTIHSLFTFYHFFLYNASRNAPQCLEPQNKTGGKKNTLLQNQIAQKSRGAQTHMIDRGRPLSFCP